MMKLIVDSGSTKADWVAINENGNILYTTVTSGLNPEILNEEEIINRLQQSIELEKHKENVTYVYFYGAGCGTDRMKDQLANWLQKYFTNAQVSVLEDTYAAVYATCHDKSKAIVSILGTGSNCSYFDGQKLIQKVQSLGYIAMDDCSGNRLGRHLLRAYYFNTMPSELAMKFGETFNMDADVVKQNLYKEPNPNAYLATFASFLIKHKNHSFCQDIIKTEIQKFIKFYINQFEDCHKIPSHFIGSIAYLLKEELATELQKQNIPLGKIIQKPIDGLIEYHTK